MNIDELLKEEKGQNNKYNTTKDNLTTTTTIEAIEEKEKTNRSDPSSDNKSLLKEDKVENIQDPTKINLEE